jgi:hypothetical protein
MNAKLTTAKQDAIRALSSASNHMTSKAKESPHGGFDEPTEKVLLDTVAALKKAYDISNSLNIAGRQKK